MNQDQHHEFRLGEWHVRPLRGVIQGPGGNRRITPKSMDVLLCLARHAGEVVERETFLQEVWHGRAYSDEPLNKCIAELRRQLGDRAGSRDYIETIPKRGYRLIPETKAIGSPLPASRQSGIRRHLRAVALAVLVALAAVGAWQLSRNVAPANDISVAVLPFANLSESGKQYFADAVYEDLIVGLSQSAALAVRSRTSSLQYRDSPQALPDIARELDVDFIVEGSVRQDGDTVLVNAQLIHADSDKNLWAGSIEKSMSVASLFSIQNEIANEITNALHVTLRPDSASWPGHLPTDNTDAYDAFMLGRFHYRRQLPGDIRESVQQFENAVALDPEFAEAWDWLAYAYNHAATAIGYLQPVEAYPKARVAALRALELDSQLATALSILGYIRVVYERDWIGGVADLERAIRLDPNDSGTVWSLAHVYSMLDRHDDGIRLTKEFADRAPEMGRRHLEVVNRLIDAHRYDEALERLAMAEARDTDAAKIADTRGVIFVGQKRYAEAATQFEFAVKAKQRDAAALGRLAYAYGKLGQRMAAGLLLTELRHRSATENISPITLAVAEIGLGNRDAAMQEVRAAAEIGGREIIGIRHGPFLAELADHPGFRAVIAGLNLPTD